MKRLALAVSLLLGFASIACAQTGPVILSAISGTVEIQAAPDQPWKTATAGAEVQEGTTIRTGPDGRAQVTFPDKAVVWIRESSNFGMQSTLPLARKVQVNEGEVKLSVPHLKRKQTFEVHAGNAVAAVRGTTFTVKSLADGVLDVKVAYGEVKLHLLTDAKTYSVPQGTFFSRQGGGAGGVNLMSHEQENDVLQNWSPGLNNDQRFRRLNQTEQDRLQIHQFAAQTVATQQAVETLVGEVKSNDFSAGRSLLDSHGNLTRVEQFLIRPDQNDVEFVNLVSRPVYNDPNEAALAAAAGSNIPFVYNGPQGGVTNRLDSLTAYVSFQTYNNSVSGIATLPQNLADWPAYFSNNSVRPDVTNVVMANQTDSGNIFVIGYFGGWCGNVTGGGGPCGDVPNGSTTNNYGQDVVATDLYVGSLNNLTAFGQLIKSPNPTTGTNSNGTMTQLFEDNNVPGGNFSMTGQANGTLVSQNAIAYCTVQGCGAGTQYMWLGTEEAVINNDGAIQNVSYFTSSNTNPFTLVSQVAGEVEVFAKNTTGGPAANPGGSNPNISGTDFVSGLSSGDNIDLVIIPDLAFSIIENMASALGHLSSSSSNSN